MNQINADQIVDNGTPENTVKPMPRDLADVRSSSNKSGLGFTNGGTPMANGGSLSYEEVSNATPNSIPLPQSPQLIGVKSQTTKIKDDGTYSVDIVIEVEDIRNVSDYEVRISKSAGNI